MASPVDAAGAPGRPPATGRERSLSAAELPLSLRSLLDEARIGLTVFQDVRPRQTVLLVLLPACAPEEDGLPWGPNLVGDTVGEGSSDEDPLDWLEDHWTPTAAVCDWPEPFAWPADEEGNGSLEEWGLYMSSDSPCRQALLADLGTDVESFGPLDDDTNRGGTSRHHILAVDAWTLLAQDAGTVDEALASGDAWHEWAMSDAFRTMLVEASAKLGQEEVRQVMYNIVTSTILETRYGGGEVDGIIADITMDGTRSMTVYMFGDGYPGITQIHEAAHPYLGVDHVVCPDTVGSSRTYSADFPGRKICDPDHDEAHGINLAMNYLYYVNWPEFPQYSDWGTEVGRGWYWEASLRESSLFIIEEWEDGIWKDEQQ